MTETMAKIVVAVEESGTAQNPNVVTPLPVPTIDRPKTPRTPKSAKAPMTARMAALPPEQRERALEAAQASTSLWSCRTGIASTASSSSTSTAMLTLEPNFVTGQHRPPKTGLALTAEALVIINGLATLGLSIWLIVDEITVNSKLSSDWRFRVLAGMSLLLDVVSHMLLFFEVAMHLSRRRSRAGNLCFLGPATAGGVWRASSAALLISLLFSVLSAGTIGSMWQPLLLPLSILVTFPLLSFYIHTPFAINTINLASSCIAFNGQGFLTPNNRVEVHTTLTTSSMTPHNDPEFIRYSEITDLQIGSSATTFQFLSRQDGHGRPALFKRVSFTQRLFYALFSIEEQQQSRKVVGFLISPDVGLYCITPNRLFGTNHRTFRDLLVTVAEKVKPEVAASVQSTFQLFDRLREDMVVHTPGSYPCCC